MTSAPTSTPYELSAKLQRALESDGFAAAEMLIREHEASLWFNLAETFEERDRDQAWECATRAFAVAPRRFKRPYARRLFALGCRLRIRTYPPEVFKLLSTSPNPDEAARISRLLQRSAAWKKLAAHGFPMPQRGKQPAYQPIPGKVLFFVDLADADGVGHDLPGYPGLSVRLDRFGVSITTHTAPISTDDTLDPEGDLQRAVDDLESVAHRERPEVIHAAPSYLAGLSAVVASRRLGIPVVVHLQRSVSDLADDDLDWYLSTAYDAALKLETSATKLADAVVCSTESLKTELIARGVVSDKITVIPPSIPIPPVAAQTRQHGQIDDGPLGLAVFGAGDRSQSDLLQVASILIDQGRKLRIILVDEQAITRTTKQTIAELELNDDVLYLDTLTARDIDQIAAQINVVVVPSATWFENNGANQNHLLALMARGNPVVVTGEAGPVGIVPTADNGIVRTSATIDSLLKMLDQLTGDQEFRTHLGASARAWVVTNRSVDQAAMTLRTLYRSLPTTASRLPNLIRPDSHDDALWTRLMKSRERKRQAQILDYTWRGRVLDLGTRNGIIAAYVALTQAPDLIVGLDPDIAALNDGQQIVECNEITTAAIEFVAAIGESLPFADRSFDGVIVTQVLEHVEHPERVLNETARVLKPNGSVLIGVPGYGTMPPGKIEGHVQDFTIDEMTKLIERSGLDLVEHRTVDIREYYFARLPDGERSG